MHLRPLTRHRGIAAALALAFVLAACTDEGRRRSDDPASGFPKPNFTAPEIANVVEPAGGWLEASCGLDPEILGRILRGYKEGRSPDVLVSPRFPNFFGGFIATGHSGPWDYLQEVPLVFYGPGYIKPVGRYEPKREVTVADIVPTLAELLGVDFPSAAGKSLSNILVPETKRDGVPKLVLEVVWDGGGTNVLETWPDFWPELGALMDRGAAPQGAVLGSSPSVTPATHTTMGTGVFPDEHGATSITIRVDGQITDSFKGKDADYVDVPMFADEYDIATGNAAKVGMFAYKSWHLGMMSHGANWPGGDKDMAVFLNPAEEYETNPNLYYSPQGLDQVPGLKKAVREIDLLDGKRDMEWMGHEVLKSKRYRRDTPVWVLHQTTILKELIRSEGFGTDDVTDLFFTNYKQPDEAGHNWNMLMPEVAETVEYTDAQLKVLVDFLNEHVGEREWVMIVTADHGQQPDAEATRGWPIFMTELVKDLAEHLGIPETEIEGTAAGMFILQDGISYDDVAEFLIGYRIEDNIPAGKEDVPGQYDDRMQEPIFEAAFPAEAADRVEDCVRSRT